jgi:hypothetical protein
MTAQVAANVTENLNTSTTTTTSTNEKTINNQLGTIVKLKIIHGKNKYNVEIGLENTVDDLKVHLETLTNVLLNHQQYFLNQFQHYIYFYHE